MIRPGPPWIERNAAPGGLVLHVYALTNLAERSGMPVLVLKRPLLEVSDDTVNAAIDDGDLVRRLVATTSPIVIVVYDGDTGERMRPTGLAADGHPLNAAGRDPREPMNPWPQ